MVAAGYLGNAAQGMLASHQGGSQNQGGFGSTTGSGSYVYGQSGAGLNHSGHKTPGARDISPVHRSHGSPGAASTAAGTASAIHDNMQQQQLQYATHDPSSILATVNNAAGHAGIGNGADSRASSGPAAMQMRAASSGTVLSQHTAALSLVGSAGPYQGYGIGGMHGYASRGSSVGPGGIPGTATGFASSTGPGGSAMTKQLGQGSSMYSSHTSHTSSHGQHHHVHTSAATMGAHLTTSLAIATLPTQ